MEASAPGAPAGGEVSVPGAPAGDEAANDAPSSLQEALEALLSKSNLARDQYLAGNMNAQMCIPVSVLLGHERLRSLGATEEEVVAAAVKSTRLSVDDRHTMVRPLLKSKRNVIILRDMPPDATEEEVKELLAGAPHADRLVYVKPDVNNTWFAKFKLDDGTQDVVLWLRGQQLRGERVNAAIKSEHFLRSFFPLPLAGQVIMPPGPPMGPMGFGAQGMPPAYAGDPSQSPPAQWAEPPPAQWADAPPDGTPMALGVGPMGKGGMPMPPMQVGPQSPGYWQPWGARYQPPPLVFTSATTLASGSMPVVAEQAAEMGPEILDNLTQPDEGKGKWGKAKGRGKGKASEERSGKGKAAAQTWSPVQEHPAQRKGRGKDGGEAGGGGGGGGGSGARWVPQAAPQTQEAPGGSQAATAVYAHDFRKYERADFERLAKEMLGERLEEPASARLLGEEIPIFRESPSVELAVD